MKSYIVWIDLREKEEMSIWYIIYSSSTEEKIECIQTSAIFIQQPSGQTLTSD